MPRLIKPPTLMGATGTRSTPRTVKPPTRSTRATPMGPHQRCKVRTVQRLFPGPTPAVNIMPRAKQQAARSMPTKTVTSTRTPGTVGSKLNQNQITTPATRLLLGDGDSRKRAAGRRRLGGPARAVGNPAPRVPVVHGAAVVAEVGVVV